MTGKFLNTDIYQRIHYSFPSIYVRFFLINENKTSLGRLMTEINVLHDGDGDVRDCFAPF
jgi:hypothetical protein